MKYTVTVSGRTVVVEVDGSGIRVDGRAVSAALTNVPRTPLRRLVLDGHSRVYVVLDGPDGWLIASGGDAHTVTVEDERARSLRQRVGGGGRVREGGVVKAPMPGLVLRVNVEPGQVIGSGASVVVLEAMKMENEIRAPAPGRVTAIHVEAGRVVEKGAVLVELSPEG